jgi:hypothetical protein
MRCATPVNILNSYYPCRGGVCLRHEYYQCESDFFIADAPCAVKSSSKHWPFLLWLDSRVFRVRTSHSMRNVSGCEHMIDDVDQCDHADRIDQTKREWYKRTLAEGSKTTRRTSRVTVHGVRKCAFLSARACTRFLTRSLLREKAHVPARAPARKARAGTRTQNGRHSTRIAYDNTRERLPSRSWKRTERSE